MIIHKNDLSSGREIPFDGATESFLAKPLRYPLRKVLKAAYKGVAYRKGGMDFLDLTASFEFEAEDTSDAKPFVYPLEISEKALRILEKEDGESEGVIFPGKDIDIEEVLLSLAHLSLPIRLTKDLGKPLR